MSDENTPENKQKGDDTFQNLKKEMDRKLSSQEAKLSELAEANKALLAKLSSMTQPKPLMIEDDIEKAWYEDPKAAAAKIKEATKAEIIAEVNRNQELQARTSQTLQALVSDYPELNDPNNELTKKAVEIYNALPADERVSPSSYRLAVKEAASDLGVVPVKRRKSQEDDSFTMSPSSSAYATKQGTSKSRKGDVDPRTIAFAQLVGLDVNNEQVMENLKAKSKRNWSKYE